MRIASRMRPEGRRGRGGYIRWEHDGIDLDTFTLSIDGVEYALGALSPITGTTYETPVPPGVSVGPHEIIIYAVNENGRTGSMEVTISW